MRRLAWLAVGVGLSLLTGCGSSTKTTVVVTTAPDGALSGRVLGTDGLPLSAALVSCQPASHVAPGNTAPASDGRFVIGAPTGRVTLTLGALGTLTATLNATAVANTTTACGVVVVPAAGTKVAGNAAPTLGAASSSLAGANVNVTASYTDGDSLAGDLSGWAYAYDAGGNLLALAPLSLAGGTASATLTPTNPGATPLAATVRVSLGDQLSGACVVAEAGNVTVAASP